MIYSLWKYFEPYANLKYSFPNGSVVKNLPEMQETCRRCGFDPWVRKILCRKKWQPAPVLLPGKSNGQRSLADDSLWDHKESDTTERLNNKFAKLLFSRSSHVRLFKTPWTGARQDSVSFTIFQSLLKHRSTESVMPSNHLVLCCLLLLLPSISPSIRGFSNESALCIRWPNYRSFSISPMNIQDWSPLVLIGLISLLTKGLSRVFSSTTVRKPQFSPPSLLYGPTLISV